MPLHSPRRNVISTYVVCRCRRFSLHRHMFSPLAISAGYVSLLDGVALVVSAFVSRVVLTELSVGYHFVLRRLRPVISDHRRRCINGPTATTSQQHRTDSQNKRRSAITA